MRRTASQSRLSAALAALLLPLTAVMLDGVPPPTPSWAEPPSLGRWGDRSGDLVLRLAAEPGDAGGLGRAGPASHWLVAARGDGEALPLE